MSVRTDIRNAVAVELRDLNLFKKVFPYRASEVAADKCPFALIYIEGADEDFDSDGVYDNVATLTIEVIAQGYGDLEAELDAISEAVNTKLNIDNTLNDLIGGFYRSNYVYDHAPEVMSCSFTQSYIIKFED
jgi:hypothetical protein